MQLFQLIFTALFIIWLFVTAYLLYRHAVSAGRHNRKLQERLAELTRELSELANKSANAAEQAAQVAQKMAEKALEDKYK